MHPAEQAVADFSLTSDQSVWLTLHGEIQDPEFLRFLEEIGRERTAAFTTDDFLVIDLVHREQPVPAQLAARLPILREQGAIERVGRGRGVRHLLSRRFYRFLGQGGTYTRKRGLDRETNKALLLRHIEESAETGATIGELQQVLPSLSRDPVRTLLRELRGAGRIEVRGATKGRAARMRRIDGLCVPAEVLKNPLDHRRILDAGDAPQPPAAAPADLDVDGEHPLEALRPGQSPLSVGGRWLAARLSLVGGPERVPGTTRARSGLAGQGRVAGVALARSALCG